jgi:hypothetical protein
VGEWSFQIAHFAWGYWVGPMYFGKELRITANEGIPDEANIKGRDIFT